MPELSSTRIARPLVLCLLAMLMFGAFSMPSASAMDIVWVSQNANDVSFRTALTNASHHVPWEAGRYQTLDATKLAELNAADLVIVARNNDSGKFDDSAQEIADWNGLTSRLLLLSAYIARNDRWKWLNSASLVAGTSANQVVVDAGDRAYAGLSVMNGSSTNAYTASATVDTTQASGAGNGTLIARTDDASGFVMAARWSAGTEFYAGSGQTAAAERVYFPTDLFAYSNFSAFGKSVYQNLIGEEKPWFAKINFQLESAPTVPGYEVDAGDVFGDRGNGLLYGWDDDITNRDRDRDVHHDQRYDTLIHAFDDGPIPKTWEIAIPNGVYYVDVLCGDPLHNQDNSLDLEGVVLADPSPGSNRFDNFLNAEVTVTDGRLTMAPSGAAEPKVCSIKILPASAFVIDPDDYAYNATVTFQGYTGSAPLTNFPVLVRLDASTPMPGWYGLADADGYDVQFADSSGNLLSHEFELWNPGGASLAWVKAPLIDDAEDSISMYWGRAGQSELSFFPIDVWSEGYESVWHLNETNGTHADSTWRGRDSTAEVVEDQNADGQIDGADRFSGANGEYINIPHSAALESIVSTNCTVSIWAKSDVAAASAPGDIAYMFDFGESHQRGVGLLFNKSHARFANGTISAYYGNERVGGNTMGNADTWYNVALTCESTSLTLFVNGAVDDVSTNSPLNLNDKPFRIGGEAKDPSNPDRNWDGLLDECRISSVTRSADWLANEYESQRAGSGYCRIEADPLGSVFVVR